MPYKHSSQFVLIVSHRIYEICTRKQFKTNFFELKTTTNAFCRICSSNEKKTANNNTHKKITPITQWFIYWSTTILPLLILIILLPWFTDSEHRYRPCRKLSIKEAQSIFQNLNIFFPFHINFIYRIEEHTFAHVCFFLFLLCCHWLLLLLLLQRISNKKNDVFIRVQYYIHVPCNEQIRSHD